MYSVDCCPKGLVIGKQGENEAEKIAIDFSPWASEFGAGTISARLRRPKDSAAYPVALITEGTTATWTISATDTQYAGAGSLQLVYIVGDVVAKSVIWPVRVLPSLEAGEAPEPYESWLDTLEGLAADTQGNARDAAASAADAAQSATSAAASAQDAAESAASITGLTAVAETLPEGSEASASFDGATDTLTLGIPKGDTGAAGPKGDTGSAGADGFSPSASVTKTDGDITITITDKDGTTSETLEVDDALDETSENPVQNQAIQNALWNMLPVDIASGAIASFPDGAYDVPMLSLKAQIEPVQDLHGYDSPWPAGGGKNLVDQPAILAVGATIESDGSYHVLYASSLVNIVVFQNDGTSGQFAVTFKYKNSGTSRGVYPKIVYTDSTEEALPINVGSTTYVTVTKVSNASKTVDRVVLVYGSNVETWFYIQVEKGNTPTSWTPYSNICPISGHTEVVTEVCGVNLADDSQFSVEQPSWYEGQYWLGLTDNGDGTYTETRPIGWGGYGLVYVGTFKSGTYFVSAELKDLASVTCAMNYIFKRKGTWDTVESYTNSSITSLGRYGASKTISEECDLWIVCAPYISNGANVKFGNIQVEVGTVMTDYHAYQGETIPVSWETEAGTVYGGEVDVVSGKLTVDRAMVDLGSLTWRYNQANLSGFDTSDIVSLVAGGNNAICSIYPNLNNPMTSGNITANDGFFRINKKADGTSESGNFGVGAVFIKDTRYTDATEFKTAMNGVQLCYELAEPIEYTITAHEVKTYLGQNNLWNDVGDTEVTYRADIQKFIEKKVNG